MDWPKSGFFRIICDADGAPEKLRYIGSTNNVEVDWPVNLQGVAAQWTIEDNYLFAKARVVGGMVAVSCTLIFQQANEQLQPPAFLAQVPTPAPSTPASAASAGSAVASPASAASPGSRSAASGAAAPVAPAGHGGAF